MPPEFEKPVSKSYPVQQQQHRVETQKLHNGIRHLQLVEPDINFNGFTKNFAPKGSLVWSESSVMVNRYQYRYWYRYRYWCRYWSCWIAMMRFSYKVLYEGFRNNPTLERLQARLGRVQVMNHWLPCLFFSTKIQIFRLATATWLLFWRSFTLFWVKLVSTFCDSWGCKWCLNKTRSSLKSQEPIFLSLTKYFLVLQTSQFLALYFWNRWYYQSV